MKSAAAARRLGGWWQEALLAGLGTQVADRLEVNMAYHADLLHQRTAQGADDPAALQESEQAAIITWAQLLGAPPITELGRLTQKGPLPTC